MGRHGYDADSSFYAWGSKLKLTPDMLDGFAAQIDRMVSLAREKYPANPALADEMAATAALIRQAQARAAKLHTMFRRLHPRDVARVEDPRGSTDRERTADVGAALRDT